MEEYSKEDQDQLNILKNQMQELQKKRFIASSEEETTSYDEQIGHINVEINRIINKYNEVGKSGPEETPVQEITVMNLDSEFERYKRLTGQNLIPRQDLDSIGWKVIELHSPKFKEYKQNVLSKVESLTNEGQSK